jgi:hypothetical protein
MNWITPAFNQFLPIMTSSKEPYRLRKRSPSLTPQSRATPTILRPQSRLHHLPLRLSAFRRNRQNGGGLFAGPAPITEFLSRDTYREGGQGLLTWVRIGLILAIIALGWMIRSFAQVPGS